MNLVNAVVTKVLSSPEYKFGKWWVDVEYDSHGRTSQTRLMFETNGEASSVDIGYEFDT